jgi:hypothetical protein
MKEEAAFMFIAKNVSVPKTSIEYSCWFMQPVPLNKDMIGEKISFVRFEIVVDEASRQRRRSVRETSQWQNRQNHMMHGGWRFPIIINVGIQSPVDVSTPPPVNVSPLHSAPVSQLASINISDRERKPCRAGSGYCGDERGNKVSVAQSFPEPSEPEQTYVLRGAIVAFCCFLAYVYIDWKNYQKPDNQ